MKKFLVILFLLITLSSINSVCYGYWTSGASDFWDWVCTDPNETPSPE